MEEGAFSFNLWKMILSHHGEKEPSHLIYFSKLFSVSLMSYTISFIVNIFVYEYRRYGQ
jgi:hypothetical protein